MKQRDEHLLDVVRQKLARAGVSYPTVRGKAFRVLRRCGLIVFPLGLLMLIFMLLGQYFYAAGGDAADADLALFWKGYAPFYLAALAVGVIGWFLIKKGLFLSGAALCVLDTAAIFARLLSRTARGNMIGTDFAAGVNPDFWLYHALPLGIPALCFAALWGIWLAQYITEGKIYRQVCARAYAQFGKTDLPPEEWDAFLAHYDPRRNTYEAYKPVFDGADADADADSDTDSDDATH